MQLKSLEMEKKKVAAIATKDYDLAKVRHFSNVSDSLTDGGN